MDLTPEENKSQESLSYEEELAKLENPRDAKSKRRLISNIILLLLLTAVVVTLFLSLGELQEIGKTFARISEGSNYSYLLAGIAVAVGFFVLYPLPLVVLAKSYQKKGGSVDAYLIGANEHFFNGVTPFAAGGQPIQMYDFAKRGMKAGAATGLVLSNFIIYLTVLNAYEAIAFVFWGDFNDAIVSFCNDILQNPSVYPAFLVAVILGYVFNLGFLVFLYFLGLSKKLAAWLVKMAKLLCKIKIVGKFLGPKIPSFEAYCENVQTVTREMFSHKWHVVGAFLIKIVVYAFYFAIPFFILRAVGIDIGWNLLPKTGFATAFTSAAVCWVPTPGGTGGIEYAFSIVLGAIAPGNFGQAQAVSLLWRMLSFYLIVLLSLVCVIIFEIRFNRDESKRKKENEERKKELREKIASLQNEEDK